VTGARPAGEGPVRGARGALWQPSPNFGERRGGARPALIVLHYTAMTSAEAALARLCDPAHQVSAHYLIGADGTLWQMVDESHRAWHAGSGCWGGCEDVNSRSIGIELDNDGSAPFAEPMMARLEALLVDLLTAYDLPPERVIGHSDLAPERKTDPGRRFDWARLARHGLSVWPDPAEPIVARSEHLPDTFRRAAARFGYPPADPALVLAAFRDRFRPAATGPLCAEDAALMQALARRWPAGDFG